MRVGSAFGIRVIMNKYFLLLLLACGIFGVLQEALFAFGAVFLHEFSHALVARSYGIKVKEIELLPFGGITKTEDYLELDSEIEIWVACAGPISNFFLIGLSYALIQLKYWDQTAAFFFIGINTVLGLFNCLPVLPLDGGRIVRAIWAQKIGFRKATERISGFGKYIAVLLLALGCWGLSRGVLNAGFFLIGIFVYFSALRENDLAMYSVMRQLVRKKEALHKEGALEAELIVAKSFTPLRDILKRTVPKKYLIVWVINEKDKMMGTVTESEIIEGMLEYGTAINLQYLLSSNK